MRDPVYGTPSPLRGPVAPVIPVNTGSRPNYRRHKIAALLGLSRTEQVRGNLAAEHSTWERALAMAELQLAESPRDPRVIDQLATVGCYGGSRFAARHDWDAACAHVRRAVARYELLADADPRSFYRERALLNALETMAQVSAVGGDGETAQWSQRLAAARAGDGPEGE
jgi:hypothetical protein